MNRRFRIPVAASAFVLGIALTTYVVARGLLSEVRHWAGSYAVANTPDGDLYLWLAVWLPLVSGAGLLLAIVLLTTRRWYSRTRLAELRGLVVVSLFSCLALAVAFSDLYSSARRGEPPSGDRTWPKQLFSKNEWSALEESRLSGEAPGRTVPHDESLLERWTLVGLSARDISRLLRSSVDLQRPRQANIPTTKVGWRMCCPDEDPSSEPFLLELTFSLYDAVVIREALYQPRRFVISATVPDPPPNQRDSAGETRRFAPGSAADPQVR